MAARCGRLRSPERAISAARRKDRNCAVCNADISIFVLLYHRLEITEGKGDDTTNLEAHLYPSFIGPWFLERSELEACGNASPESCAWLEAATSENQHKLTFQLCPAISRRSTHLGGRHRTLHSHIGLDVLGDSATAREDA